MRWKIFSSPARPSSVGICCGFCGEARIYFAGCAAARCSKAARAVVSVNVSDSRGTLVTNDPTIQPSPVGISRVSEIAWHSTYVPPSYSSNRQ
jgi:hypothetical protein